MNEVGAHCEYLKQRSECNIFMFQRSLSINIESRHIVCTYIVKDGTDENSTPSLMMGV